MKQNLSDDTFYMRGPYAHKCMCFLYCLTNTFSGISDERCLCLYTCVCVVVVVWGECVQTDEVSVSDQERMCVCARARMSSSHVQ